MASGRFANDHRERDLDEDRPATCRFVFAGLACQILRSGSFPDIDWAVVRYASAGVHGSAIRVAESNKIAVVALAGNRSLFPNTLLPTDLTGASSSSLKPDPQTQRVPEHPQQCGSE